MRIRKNLIFILIWLLLTSCSSPNQKMETDVAYKSILYISSKRSQGMPNDLKYTDEELLNMPIDKRLQVFINNGLDLKDLNLPFEKAKWAFKVNYIYLIEGFTTISSIHFSFSDKVKEVYKKIVKRDILR